MPSPDLTPDRTPSVTAVVGRRPIVAGAAAATLIAVLAAIASVVQIGLSPPEVSSRSLTVGAATAHAIVGPKLDRGDLTDVDALTASTDVDTRIDRAELVANVISSPAVVNRTGLRMGIDAAAITAATQVTASVPDALTEPGFDDRAAQILGSENQYRLDVQANPALPILDIYALGPTAAEASRLANASIAAANAYLRSLAGERATKSGGEEAAGTGAGVRLTGLGSPAATTLNARAPIEVAALTFVVVLGLCIGGLLLIVVVARGWRAVGKTDSPATPVAADPPGDAWPRTTRVLPWMLAGFMAMLWLVPFNGIAIDASLPIDLKLDRILLPGIVLLWLLAIAAGGRGAPSRRVTVIHAAIAAFAAVAFLSVVVNAGSLTQGLSFDLTLKKLTLLAAYASVFAVTASVVRRNELRSFLRWNLALAVLCGIGVIWEYRFGFNVFYEVAAGVLPSAFDVQTAPFGFDELGRRSVSGPTDHSLEIVAILSMALPIALVGLIRARNLRSQVPNLLAACILGIAIISTYRKSAFLAPAAAVVTIAWLARREALKLAPLALIALVVLPLTSFSAFGSIADQFDSGQLGVPTVDDRVSDYDAVRPDILSNPVLGRGFGSYEHTHGPGEARILDSDLLLRTVETGVVGLGAFLLMIVTVIAIAAGEARRRGPRGSPVAITTAAAATAFLSLTALFDEWSFPHAPYVFMILAGFLAASMGAPTGNGSKTAAAAEPWAPGVPVDREKRASANVSLEDVRHHRTGPAVSEPGGSGAAEPDVRPAGASRA
jgi:O-Antigen ligase